MAAPKQPTTTKRLSFWIKRVQCVRVFDSSPAHRINDDAFSDQFFVPLLIFIIVLHVSNQLVFTSFLHNLFNRNNKIFQKLNQLKIYSNFN